jgi:aryl-alcohol dehydrogenase-like predicted oxidoreductase
MGTMQFGWTADRTTSLQILANSLEAGINFFDTADIYSRWVEGNPGGVAEEILGDWITTSSVQRDEIVLATKVRGSMSDDPNDEGLSRRHIMNAVEASLRRLKTDYIDLYQLHWPDDEIPIEETLTALDDLISAGKVRYIGCSNYPAWQLVEALWASDRLGLNRFVSIQPHYNLVHRQEYERELEAVAVKYELGVIPYSPLAGGFLTGKYQPGASPEEGTRGASSDRIRVYLSKDASVTTLSTLIETATELGATPSQVALAWVLQRPSVTAPIIGPRNLTQLENNLAAIDLRLPEQKWGELADASVWE